LLHIYRLRALEELEEKYLVFSDQIKDICSHVSVRDDENGPYIFALGLKETHTLQMRKIKNEFVLELWHGASSEVEEIVSEPSFSDIKEAFREAIKWLNKDAI